MGKHAIIELLNQKVTEAKEAGKTFHWTGINNGTFFDWYVELLFVDFGDTDTLIHYVKGL